MTTIIFVNVPAHGHTNPTLPLVRELVQRGHQVFYYSVDDFQHVIEQTGATFRSYQHLISLDYTHPDQNLFRLATMLIATTVQLMPPLLAMIQQEQPDLIIYDSLCPWGKYVAQVLAIPAVCSTTTFAITARLALGSLSDVMRFMHMLVTAMPHLHQFQKLSQQLTREYQIPRVQPLDMFQNQAELTLVYTSKEFQPYAESFSNHYQFTGPSLNLDAGETNIPITIDDNMQLVYISLGTLFNNNIDFYRLCFDVVRDMKVHCLVSVGKHVSLGDLGDVPQNVTVRSSVPQIAVLQRAQAFITHGGMNSVHEALYFGVPMVVVPQAADQLFVAQQVHHAGAGIQIDQHGLKPARLRNALEQILANRAYQQASQQIGASLKAAGGYLRAADCIEQFMRASTLTALEPATAHI